MEKSTKGMQSYVEVKGKKIGIGIPKICVSIVGKTKKEIIEKAVLIREEKVDMAEWRADWFEEVMDQEQVLFLFEELSHILSDIPVIFTFRTLEEGGERAISIQDYIDLNKRIVLSGNADIIDVELSAGEKVMRELVEYAHARGIKVIASSHDFKGTPDKEEMTCRLEQMKKLNADILKLAVMPRDRSDVLRLLDVTQQMHERQERPIVTMSMGKDGLVSRIAGECFGSAITFGALKDVSAPGQMEVSDLKKMLDIIHKNI